MKKFLNTFFKTLKINKSEVRLHLKDYFMHSKLLDVHQCIKLLDHLLE